MPKQKLLIICCLLAWFNTRLHAQSNAVSGGEASGPNGSISYSIGQIDYKTLTGPDGSITEGVQQPFEIFIILGIDNKEISLISSAYPNPTNGMLTIAIENEGWKKMQYQITDANGRMINRNKLAGKQTTLSLEEFAGGIYYVSILDNKSELKTFKIVKN